MPMTSTPPTFNAAFVITIPYQPQPIRPILIFLSFAKEGILNAEINAAELKEVFSIKDRLFIILGFILNYKHN
jgi:hypothetical protein